MGKHAALPGLPIDGAERPPAQGWTFPVHSPATGELLWDVPDAGTDDVEVAVEAAWRAVHATGWSTDPGLRLDGVRRFQEALADAADELTTLLAAETGVPVALRDAHVDAPIAELRGSHEDGQPGVTVLVTPATAPLSVALPEIGRVLSAGGAVVLKPAPETASAALAVGRLALDFLPRGVLNVVTTRDVDVAIALTLDRRVDEVSFTGSAVAGERVRVAAAGAGKRVRLDVGAPVQLHATDDDRLEAVVAEAAAAVAANAGQGCRLPSSVVVPIDRYPDALRAAMAAMEDVVVGDPLDAPTWCGPLRSRVARDRVLRYLSLARAEGGDVVLGGHVLDRDGWWLAPTVIGGLDRESRVVREEVLGPVLTVVAESSGHA
ncbi:aldehyde dehydrogenase family protein [Nocardioides sp. SYSU D00065]|uniref:aldehyde dehydrogenase family protein n=1 Tax=Nocardioides sp. SYSU D00065 TaxID=2817378 RepID=UPI001B344E5C|nr:aldehyde dehydrogenase family protein [Nocardioides sp. SYSU D00065]